MTNNLDDNKKKQPDRFRDKSIGDQSSCLISTTNNEDSPATPVRGKTDTDEGTGSKRSRVRTQVTPIVTTPLRGLSGASSSDDGGDFEENRDSGYNDEELTGMQDSNSWVSSFHNSRGVHLPDNSSASQSNRTTESSGCGTDNNPRNNVSPDQERQILLLMLLAQVCALHDPTPRTFTVHVLELFERGILGRQSIHFLFELGLVPRNAPRMLPPSTTVDEGKEEIFDLTAVSSTNGPLSPQTLRAQEASAIRSHLEQHDLAHQRQQAARASPNSNHPDAESSFPQPFVDLPLQEAAVNSPTSGELPTRSEGTPVRSSWAVEHHPLSLSRYQREFHQVRLLNAGSFGEVFQSTNKIDLKDYAVKRVAFSAWGYSKDSVAQVIREVHCLAQCDHPNVVRYYTSWLEPSWMTGSGATQMMSTSGTEVRRQQKLLTDIQHMMESGEEADSSIEQSDWRDISPSASSNGNHNIQMFFQEQAATLRNRKFSIGSSFDDGSLDGGSYSSFDESRSSESERHCSRAWDIDTTENTGHDDIFDRSGESILILDSKQKEAWNPPSSAPHPPKHSDAKKQQQQVTSNARSKYRYQICLFIQMQLCHPATLGDWMRHRNSQCQDPARDRHERVQTAAKIFGQIAGGLEHIHKKGIMHRDLKPMNLFRSLEDEGVFLIGDFGLSKLIHAATHQKRHGGTSTPPYTGSENAIVHHPPTTEFSTWQDPLTAGVGTASYAAPEQVATTSYGKQADIFSIGLILLELLCCFTTEHERIQTFNDCRSQREIPDWIVRDYPTAAKTILACTNPVANERPTAEELVKFDLLLGCKATSFWVGDEASCKQFDADAAVGGSRLEALARELDKKNEQIRAYKESLAEKDRIIEDMRCELALLRLQATPQVESESPRRLVGAAASRMPEFESSSSSSE